MSTFNELVAMCKGGVFLTVNDHRNVYESVEQYLEQREAELDSETRGEMVARDALVELQAYPDTPVGSYLIWHWDVDYAIAAMLATIRSSRA